MKIAIVGGGISGLVCAYLLHEEHEIVLFEANDYVGGHTNTIDVERASGSVDAVDTGFIVFNDWTYPNFIRLLDRLGVESQDSSMSFSVRCEKTGLEYNGTSLDALFTQRRNLLRPRFLRMIRDILRFNKESVESLDSGGLDDGISLMDYVRRNRYSDAFIEYYLIPIGSSIWSSDPRNFGVIPARFFVAFLRNHGMLTVDARPTWRVVKGGSRQYVRRLLDFFGDRVRTSCPVMEVRRSDKSVTVTTDQHGAEEYDHLIFASHSNQSLRMLADATAAEKTILSAIPYQANDTVLHTDSSILPRRKKAWASWNYHRLSQDRNQVALTYNMNILQSLSTDRTYCVTLNHREAVDRSAILKEFVYHHPVYTSDSTRAQDRWEEISGVDRTHYCGAYWGNGFHEDGVNSALRVCDFFGKSLVQ
ncbi:MAG: FAD-dependent oxidoreductase [Sumerlaeia bacterium]